MSAKKKQKTKTSLHPRNKNRGRYDLATLRRTSIELEQFIIKNKYGDNSINFANPAAVKALNKALLKHYYGIGNWNFPDKYLCPPIPGRVDYLHYMADLLAESNDGVIPIGKQITALDIGIGANCIYPILGVVEYGWNFIGSDIKEETLAIAQRNIDGNEALKDKISCRLQADKSHLLKGILAKNERVDFTMSNPPFHTSLEAAQKGSRRKVKNLSGKKESNPTLNFSGISDELIYDGGEYKFIHTLILESKVFSEQCLWFSTLVSKESNLKGITQLLNKIKVPEYKTIAFGTSNKKSRILAWTFLSKEEQNAWAKER